MNKLTLDDCKGLISYFKSDPNFNMPALLQQAIEDLIKIAEGRRYFIREDGGEWQEVDKERFILAERSVGFRPQCATDPDSTCATAGFSGPGISGRIETREEA